MKPVEQEIHQRFVKYLESKDFNPFLKRLERPPLWRYLVAFVTFMTTIGIPITLYQIYKILTHRRRRRRELIAWAKGARPLMTYGLMVNSALRTRPGEIAPGLVIGSFDPEANVTAEFMVDLAERILELSLADPTTPEEHAAHALMSDEVYEPGRRRLLPMALTQGREVYAFDLIIVGDYQPNGIIEAPMIPCLADPGPEGEIRMIPWWIVTREPAPART